MAFNGWHATTGRCMGNDAASEKVSRVERRCREHCRRCLTFARTGSGVFHLRSTESPQFSAIFPEPGSINFAFFHFLYILSSSLPCRIIARLGNHHPTGFNLLFLLLFSLSFSFFFFNPSIFPSAAILWREDEVRGSKRTAITGIIN